MIDPKSDQMIRQTSDQTSDQTVDQTSDQLNACAGLHAAALHPQRQRRRKQWPWEGVPGGASYLPGEGPGPRVQTCCRRQNTVMLSL